MMKPAKYFLLILSLCALAALPLSAQGKRAMAFDDLVSMARVSDPQISPDGKWVAYTLGNVDKAANRTNRNIWLVSIDGGQSRQLTTSGRDMQPQWSPDGKWLSFTSRVYADCKDDACNEKRDAERDKSKVKARIYDALLYRHWDEWWDYKRSHLFVVSADGSEPRDLTPAWNYDVPPVQRGAASDIGWSPDSQELCFVAVTDPVEAISTNGDIFRVPSAGGEAKRITTSAGFDGGCTYSPDGKWIAYRSQRRGGFEADLWRLMLYDRKSATHTVLNEAFDRSAEDLAWSPDSKTVYFTAENHGQKPVYSVAATPGASPRVLAPDTYNSDARVSSDGRTLVFLRMSMTMPFEIFAAASDGSNARQITKHNAERLAALDLNPAEHLWFEGAGGTKVHGMLVRPPGFDATKKYPLVLIAHGGPQTQFGDAWSYRWNTQMFAARGWVILCINRRGSTGFGQKFTDEISNTYGTKDYEDLMKGVDYVLGKYPFVDGNRMGAAGASFGGFMMNWFAGHTGRFKAIVTHDGIFEQVSMYGGTEELWFLEWDQGGMPWTNPEGYRRASPGTYAAEFAKYKTPTLVIHGELDFRVPYEQGLQMFTALQRQGVPSRLLIFPDEGHWVLKPQNSELWYKTVLEWLATYVK